jgi:hypothetical protein
MRSTGERLLSAQLQPKPDGPVSAPKLPDRFTAKIRRDDLRFHLLEADIVVNCG